MRLLLIGASGVLGSRLYKDAINKKWTVLGTYCSHAHEGLSYLDLRDRESIEKIFKLSAPEAIVLAGGITNVDLCELRPGLAEDVNVKGTAYLVSKAKEKGTKLVFLSTDYVFDGKSGPYMEEDKPCPVNVYGRTKLEGERIVESRLKDYLIVRTAQLYGMDHNARNFAIKIIQRMRNNQEVYAADDFYCTPTYVTDLSDAVIKLLEDGKKGIFNVAGTDFIDRYEYVEKIADIFGLKKSLIKKTKLKDLSLKAVRPQRAGLKVDKAVKELDIRLSNCKHGLELLRKEAQ
ncbi:SDR family oxidoreductase [Candidatus Omnitrophota bacterium]